MKTKNETESLNELIRATEKKSAYELVLLKEQFHGTYESLKPINLIKSLFHDVTRSPEIKNDFVSNAIGLGTGILSKKLLMGGTHNPIKRMLGTVLEFAIANLVSTHTDDIKNIGGNLMKKIFKPSKH